jgi:cytochrome c biogenesis protein CcdA
MRAPAAARSAPRIDPRASNYAALTLLGVTVTAMELPAAVPYFGAIALLTAADLRPAQWMPLLVLYNVIVVLPHSAELSYTGNRLHRGLLRLREGGPP